MHWWGLLNMRSKGISYRYAGSVLALIGLLSGCATKKPPEAVLLPSIPHADTAHHDAGNHEAPPILWADAVFEPADCSGPYHYIEPVVQNDGAMNHVRVISDFGEFAAVGNEMARIRVTEVGAIATLREMKTREAYKRGVGQTVKDTALGPFRQARKILSNPLYAVAMVPGEIFKYLGIASGALDLLRHGLSKDQWKEFIGYYDARADLARQLGVNPYTTNPVLSQELDEVAWAFYSGAVPLDLAAEFLPGIPMTYHVGTGSATLGHAIDEIRPAGTRRKLRRMDVPSSTRKAYLENAVYTPRSRRALAGALFAIKNADNMEAFFRLAVQAATEDEAYACQRLAELILAYHEQVERIARVDEVDGTIAAQTVAGGTVAFLYADYLCWTPALARFSEGLPRRAPGAEAHVSRDLWISGIVSERARAELTKRGFTLQEDAFAHLAKMERTDAPTP